MATEAQIDPEPPVRVEGEAGALMVMTWMNQGQSGVNAARLTSDALSAQAGDRTALRRLRVGAGWKPSTRLPAVVGRRTRLPRLSAPLKGRRRRPPRRARVPDRPASSSSDTGSSRPRLFGVRL